MKKPLIAASLIGNVVLLTGLLLIRSEHQSEVRDLALGAMRGDEIHLRLHASALAAIESPGSDDAITTTDMLRKVIAAGAKNIEARRSAGLGP